MRDNESVKSYKRWVIAELSNDGLWRMMYRYNKFIGYAFDNLICLFSK